MKKRVSYTQVLDDFDRTSEAQTVTFALEGVRYEIDLTDANRKELHEILAPYVDRARRLGGKPKAKAKARSKGVPRQRSRSKDVRQWAVEQGIEVNATGRVPQSVVKQYEAARS